MPKPHNEGRSIERAYLTSLILAAALYGYFSRFLGKANTLVDLWLLIGAILFVGGLVAGRLRFASPVSKSILAALGWLTLGLVFSVISVMSVRAPIQYSIYLFFAIPFFFVDRITPRHAYMFFLPLLLCIGSAQLAFDLAFSNSTQAFELDAYSGTFSIANHKSRFLFPLLLASIFIYRGKSISVRYLLSPLMVLAIGCSLYLGYSNAAYALGLASLGAGLFYRRKALLIIWGVGIYFFLQEIIRVYADEPFVFMSLNRFLDEKHGAYAIVLYGIELVGQSNLMGVGLGEFISRTSQSFHGLYLDSVPRTMISWNEIYDNVVTPFGVPSLVSLATEAGVWGIGFFSFICLALYQFSHRSFLGFSLFVYIILNALLVPNYFETADFLLFNLSFALISRALHYQPENAQNPIYF